MRKAQAGAGWPVYHNMWGPTEFCCTGSLKNYDRTGYLSEIFAPTLLTCGRHDTATPETTKYYQSLLPDAQFVVFTKSAHMPHLEESKEYLTVVRRFLNRVDKNIVTSGGSE